MLNKHGWWFMGKKRMFMSDMLIISYHNISDNYIFSAWDLSLSVSLLGVILGWVRAGTCTVGTVTSMELILCSMFRFFLSVIGNSKISEVQHFPVQSFLAGCQRYNWCHWSGTASGSLFLPKFVIHKWGPSSICVYQRPLSLPFLLSIDMGPTIINYWTTPW